MSLLSSSRIFMVFLAWFAIFQSTAFAGKGDESEHPLSENPSDHATTEHPPQDASIKVSPSLSAKATPYVVGALVNAAPSLVAWPFFDGPMLTKQVHGSSHGTENRAGETTRPFWKGGFQWNKVRSSYRGFVPYIASRSLSGALNLPLGEGLKEAGLSNGQAGLASSMVLSVANNPFHTFLTRKFAAPKDGAPYTGRTFIAEVCSSPSLPFTGIMGNFMKHVGNIAFFSAYQEAKEFLAPMKGREILLGRTFDQRAINGVAALLASSVAIPLQYPFQTIAINKQKDPDKSYIEIFRKLNAEGGLKRFYAGISRRATKTLVTGTLATMAYEEIKEYFLDSKDASK